MASFDALHNDQREKSIPDLRLVLDQIGPNVSGSLTQVLLLELPPSLLPHGPLTHSALQHSAVQHFALQPPALPPSALQCMSGLGSAGRLGTRQCWRQEERNAASRPAPPPGILGWTTSSFQSDRETRHGLADIVGH